MRSKKNKNKNKKTKTKTSDECGVVIVCYYVSSE